MPGTVGKGSAARRRHDEGEPTQRHHTLEDGTAPRHHALEDGTAPRRAAARRRVFAVTLVCVLGSALTVGLCAWAGGRSYVLGSIVVVTLSLVPFVAAFESRKPRARDLVTVAVMAALAVVSRMAFAWAPGLKPTLGIVMLAGVALGPASGFFVGAVTALASNFLFGQGPWTPWQMLSFGLAGFLFGLFARHGAVPRSRWSAKARVLASALGFLVVALACGPVLDTSSLFFMLSSVTLEGVLAVYAAGLPANLVLGLSTAVTLALVGNPLLAKLERLRVKYGVGE